MTTRHKKFLNIASFLALNAMPMAQFAKAEEVKLAATPRVLEISGQVVLIPKMGQQVLMKKGEILREKAEIETSAASQVKLEMNDGSVIIVLEKTRIRLPVITWDQGEVRRVELLSGQIRVLQTGAVERSFETPLSNDRYPSSDFLMSYLPEAGRVEMIVIKGEIYFRGLENEEGIQLKAGERSAFQGVYEAGELTYDVLLKGRKVARGKLSPAERIPADTLAKWEALWVVAKPKPKPPPPKPQRKPGQICENPFGKLDQCAWTCQGNPKKAKSCELSKPGVRCVRTRCNANGLWSDEFLVAGLKSRCGVDVIVAACDY